MDEGKAQRASLRGEADEEAPPRPKTPTRTTPGVIPGEAQVTFAPGALLNLADFGLEPPPAQLAPARASLRPAPRASLHGQSVTPVRSARMSVLASTPGYSVHGTTDMAALEKIVPMNRATVLRGHVDEPEPPPVSPQQARSQARRASQVQEELARRRSLVLDKGPPRGSVVAAPEPEDASALPPSSEYAAWKNRRGSTAEEPPGPASPKGAKKKGKELPDAPLGPSPLDDFWAEVGKATRLMREKADVWMDHEGLGAPSDIVRLGLEEKFLTQVGFISSMHLDKARAYLARTRDRLRGVEDPHDQRSKVTKFLEMGLLRRNIQDLSGAKRDAVKGRKVFFSVLPEARRLAEQLRKRLQDQYGVASYLETHLAEEELGDRAEHLQACDLAVVFGTSDYGKRTVGGITTFEEMEWMQKNKRFVVLKMCDEFKFEYTSKLLSTAPSCDWRGDELGGLERVAHMVASRLAIAVRYSVASAGRRNSQN